MQSTYSPYGQLNVSWNLQEEKLYSPDGLQHLLVCDVCNVPVWVSLPTVAVVCQQCATNADDCACDERGM